MSSERARGGGARLTCLGLVATIWAVVGCRERLVVGMERVDEPRAVVGRSDGDGGGEEAADQAEDPDEDDEDAGGDEEDSEDDDDVDDDAPDQDE